MDAMTMITITCFSVRFSFNMKIMSHVIVLVATSCLIEYRCDGVWCMCRNECEWANLGFIQMKATKNALSTNYQLPTTNEQTKEVKKMSLIFSCRWFFSFCFFTFSLSKLRDSPMHKKMEKRLKFSTLLYTRWTCLISS